mgnify:CR=1 FL=1
MKKHLTVPLLLLPGVGYLLVFFGLPLFLAVAGGFGLFTLNAESRFTLGHYQSLFTDRAYRDSLLFTLYLAITSTLFSFVGKAVFRAIYKIPLIVPSIVAAFLVLTLLDLGGVASRWFGLVGVSLPKLVRDPLAIGTLIALAWKNIPFMTLIIGGSLASINQDLPYAARTLGATPFVSFLRVQVPLALPGISAATLLVFIGNMAAFAIPNLLGPVYPLPLSIHMYQNAFELNEWGLVSAMGTFIGVVSGLVLLAYYALTNRAQRALEGRK